MQEVRLPELGENVDTADVAAVLVKVGQRVEADQPLIEVETEKANLEVPAPSAGTVTELLVEVGDKIRVGQVIVKLDAAVVAAERTAPSPPAPAAARSEPQVEPPPPPPRESVPEKQKKTSSRKARGSSRKAETAEPDPVPATEPVAVATPGSAPEGRRSVIEFPAAPARPKPEIGVTVPAAPSVRRLARELGLDVREVPGSGPGGRISHEDVKAQAKRVISGAARGGVAAFPELPDFAQWGEIVREPLSAVRRATARNMTLAWSTVPHVTQFDRADISQLESMRKRFNQREDQRGRKLTLTAIVIKMVASALRQFPRFNASLDMARETVVLKKYVHVGVAVDTGRGLLVPVIRDADGKSLVQIASELDELAERARNKKLEPDEMSGASFTVSNLGGLGTTYFSPIVAWPQVAILGVGRAEQQAIYEEGQFRPRLMLPLSLSYDHRLIDGADAARFLRWLAEALEQPLLLVADE